MPMTEKTYWGYHLIINAAECDHNAITNADTIYDFTKKLVKDIDMVAFGEPQIVKFGHGDKQGYTLVQLIETSNICCHFVDDTDDLYLDVFSCKPFDQKVVVNLVEEFFGCKKFEVHFLNRQA